MDDKSKDAEPISAGRPPEAPAMPVAPPPATPVPPKKIAEREAAREFLRAENEDDDGYDPYSDRRPVSEPLFERDPWN